MTENTEADFFSHYSSLNKWLDFSVFGLLICKMEIIADTGLLRELRMYQKAGSSFKIVTQSSYSLLCK